MGAGLRKFVLSTHLTFSIGWIGAVAAYLILDLSVATSHDEQTVRASWIGMGSITSRAIVPLALASLITGLVMAFGTRWGLLRHWWVLISFLLTVLATAVLLLESGHISRTAALAADPTTSAHEILALPNTLPHSIGGMVVLFVVQVLNMYKPRGLTRYGWRKQEEWKARQRHAPDEDR
jgi:hypothetical protein